MLVLVVYILMSSTVFFTTGRGLPGESGIYRVTAYCACEKCCGEYADGMTASGHKIASGDRFAAASRAFSFGTLLYIPGYNGEQPVFVKDRGGAIKGCHIDVYLESHREALIWGNKYLFVKVLDGQVSKKRGETQKTSMCLP